MSAKEDKVKETIIKKYSEFYDMTNAMSADELKKELRNLSTYREEVEFAKDDDEDLLRAKNLTAELSAPYNDAIKVLKLKVSYLYLLLKESGQIENSKSLDKNE